MPELNLGDLKVTSAAFDHGGRIPDRHSNAGGNELPELRWENVPEGTRELVVMVHDPDAPLVDGFTHWVAIGINPDSPGVGGDVETPFVSGLNSVGEAAYMGPAPPPGHGSHHYFFHVYALDKTLDHKPLPDRAMVLADMEGHIIEQARVVGTYSTE